MQMYEVYMTPPNIFPLFLCRFRNNSYICNRLEIARKGIEGQDFVGKRTLRTLSSTVESRKFKSQKIRNRSVHFGCIVPCSFLWAVSIYHDVGYLELLILRRGNARALPWDKRDVEHPRLSVYITNR